MDHTVWYYMLRTVCRIVYHTSYLFKLYCARRLSKIYVQDAISIKQLSCFWKINDQRKEKMKMILNMNLNYNTTCIHYFLCPQSFSSYNMIFFNKDYITGDIIFHCSLKPPQIDKKIIINLILPRELGPYR